MDHSMMTEIIAIICMLSTGWLAYILGRKDGFAMAKREILEALDKQYDTILADKLEDILLEMECRGVIHRFIARRLRIRWSKYLADMWAVSHPKHQAQQEVKQKKKLVLFKR